MSLLQNTRTRIILLVIGGIVLLGGIGMGTFTLLRQLKPAILHTASQKGQNDQSSQPSSPDATRQQAETLVKEGKLAEAKTAYQTALAGYVASNNTSAAADVKTQLAILDAMLKNQPTTKQQSSTPHQSGSVK